MTALDRVYSIWTRQVVWISPTLRMGPNAAKQTVASTPGSFEASAYVLSKSRPGRDPAEPGKQVRKVFGRKLRVPEAVVPDEAVGLGRTGDVTQRAH